MILFLYTIFIQFQRNLSHLRSLVEIFLLMCKREFYIWLQRKMRLRQDYALLTSIQIRKFWILKLFVCILKTPIEWRVCDFLRRFHKGMYTLIFQSVFPLFLKQKNKRFHNRLAPLFIVYHELKKYCLLRSSNKL